MKNCNDSVGLSREVYCSPVVLHVQNTLVINRVKCHTEELIIFEIGTIAFLSVFGTILVCKPVITMNLHYSDRCRGLQGFSYDVPLILYHLSLLTVAYGAIFQLTSSTKEFTKSSHDGLNECRVTQILSSLPFGDLHSYLNAICLCHHAISFLLSCSH